MTPRATNAADATNATNATMGETRAGSAAPTFDVEVFFDGECPLCTKEVDFVRRLDRRARVRFVDIASPSFDAASIGRTHDELMARIHARLPDGNLVEGVEVFRLMYAATGLRPLVALTRLPGITQLLDASYTWFAKNRLRLTGRCDADACTPAPRAKGVASSS